MPLTAAEKRMSALHVCACCGVRDVRLEYHHEPAITSLSDVHWLRASLHFVKRLAAVQFDLLACSGSSYTRVPATRLDLHHVCRVTGADGGSVVVECGAAAAARGGGAGGGGGSG